MPPCVIQSFRYCVLCFLLWVKHTKQESTDLLGSAPLATVSLALLRLPCMQCSRNEWLISDPLRPFLRSGSTTPESGFTDSGHPKLINFANAALKSLKKTSSFLAYSWRYHLNLKNQHQRAYLSVRTKSRICFQCNVSRKHHVLTRRILILFRSIPLSLLPFKIDEIREVRVVKLNCYQRNMRKRVYSWPLRGLQSKVHQRKISTLKRFYERIAWLKRNHTVTSSQSMSSW